MNHLIKRQQATQATIDKFLGQPMRWGIADCARMARFHLHRAGVAVPFWRGARYRSEEGALAALSELGFACLTDAVDATGFARIPPASAWAGDLVALPSATGGPFDIAINIAVGNGRLFGLHRGAFCVIAPAQFTAAWRVPVDG